MAWGPLDGARGGRPISSTATLSGALTVSLLSGKLKCRQLKGRAQGRVAGLQSLPLPHQAELHPR